MTKTQKAIEIIDAEMSAGKTHTEAAKAAKIATGLAVYSEGPIGSEGKAYFLSVPRANRRSLFDVFVRRPDGKFGRLLTRHYAGKSLPLDQIK